MEKKYYQAYDERYKTVHDQGLSWSSDLCTPIVMETIHKYNITSNYKMLEIGCGEGRDSRVVLENGYDLMATDISNEAIEYCKRVMPNYKNCFTVLDCLSNELNQTFNFIYGIAVIHMLVLDEDRDRFYQFIYHHLNNDGIALICTMGDGNIEMQSDISKAFELQERNHGTGKVMVAGTSCRMVSFDTFEKELSRNKLEIIEKGIASSMPDFDSLMYAIVRKIDIKRINNYKDHRFSQTVLNQHGAYLIHNKPYEVEIISNYEAIIRGSNSENYLSLIEEFRFNAPHITKFYNEKNQIIKELPLAECIDVSLDLIQPSQFYVDKDKVNAISTFIKNEDNIVIQVMKYGNRYISLDGHTRLYYALQKGFNVVKAIVCEEENDWTYKFVNEAQKRNIYHIHDMILVSHNEYEVLWNDYCDSLFGNE